MDYMVELRMLAYLAIAMVLGALVGWERELADKPAGMRTHMLVAGAAALFVLLADILVKHFGSQFGAGLIRSDPIRVIEAIVTGVAFLGAGTIIRRGNRGIVEGLTTAGSLLYTSAIGICAALQELTLAGGATVMALITLRAVRAIEKRLGSRNPE